MNKPRRDRPASPNSSPDDRSPTARAAEWASRIMTVSLEMVLPGLAGYWLDLQLGTRVVFMLVGFAVGMYVATRHLLHLLKSSDGNRGKSEEQLDDPTHD